MSLISKLSSAALLATQGDPGPWLVGHKGWPHAKGGAPYVETSQLGGDGITYGGVCWAPDLDEDDDRNVAEAQATYIALACPENVQKLIAVVEAAKAHEAAMHRTARESATGTMRLLLNALAALEKTP